MSTKQQHYQAYMLRLWRTGSTEGLAWRASLENAQTGARQGFADVKALCAFLEGATDQALSALAERCYAGADPISDPGSELGSDEKRPTTAHA